MLLRKKKIMTRLLVITMCVNLIPAATAFGEENGSVQATVTSQVQTANALQTTGAAISVTDESDFEFDAGTGTITKYIGSDAVVVIPSEIGGVSVRSIGASAFNENTIIESVTIPNGVTEIQKNAFRAARHLTNMVIPGSVTSIGEDSFSECNSLKSIEIPDGVTKIASGTFSGCSSLENVKISNNVTSIGNSAFYYCKKLTNIVIPNGINFIDIGAFDYCEGLTSITIPKSVTYINYDIFTGCINLKDINVDSANVNYSSIDGVLYNKEGTKIVRYPEGKTSEEYIIPDGVTDIGDSAFSECKTLKAVLIPGSITSIGNNAFFQCSSNIIIVVRNEEEKQLLIKSGVDESKIMLNDEAKIASKFEFDSSTGTITKYIGSDTTIVIPSSINGVQVTKIGGASLGGSAVTSVIIPSGVTTIGMEAFLGCSNLTSITIPDTVTGIENYAFQGCSSLKSIKIPNSINKIGSQEFYGCSSLTNVIIPSSVTSIENYAFSGCTSLAGITIPSSVTSIGSNAFQNSNNTIFYVGNEIIKGLLTSNGIDESKIKLIDQSTTDEVEFEFDAGTGTITKYVGNDAAVVIPNEISGVKVKSIGVRAFAECRGVTSIAVSEGITSIGFSAFEDCTNLKSITIPASVTNIDLDITHYCSSLTDIYVDSNNLNYKSVEGVLFNKSGTELITYPVGKMDTYYVVPEGVVSIKNWAFDRTIYLENVTLSSTVANLGEVVFSQCYGIVNINVNNSNEKYKSINGVLFNKLGTELIKYPIGKIEESYVIPDGVQTIKFDAFDECNKLKSIKIPSSITTIENSAFSGCFNLQNVNIPSGVSKIARNTFSGCSSLKSIDIPSNVTSIEEDAFYYCTGLTSITVPSSVKSIEKDAFRDCNNAQFYVADLATKQLLVSSGVDESKITVNSEPTTVSDFEFNPGTGTITKYLGNDTKVVIPSEIGGIKVTSIGNSAFVWKQNIKEVVIPSSITSIGENAFGECESLSSIIIPDSVTSIGNCAFGDCKSLTNITIPNGITSIGYRVFYGCSKLISINIPNSVTTIGDDAFEYCSSLTSINIPDSVSSIGNSAFGWCISLTSITIPNNVKSIGNQEFYGCSALTNVNLPKGITSIGSSAFSDCSSLTSIIIPDSVNKIAAYAFARCAKLKNIAIPENVTSIEQGTFEDCSSLTSIVIPNSVTSIGDTVFYNCSSLISITIPNKVTRIGYNEFYGCTALKSVTIPNSVTSIGQYTFDKCNIAQFYVYSQGVKQLLIYSGVGESTIILNGQSSTIKATSVALNTANLNLIAGQTGILTATILPSNVSNKGLTWKSSNTAVATVDASGKVTAVGAGSATITCAASDGSGKSAICAVTVKNPVKVTTLSLNKTSLGLVKGYTSVLTATILPINVTNKGVTWKSNNASVVTVDANGKVTGVGVGSATITCTANDGSGKYAKCVVNVMNPIKATGVNLNTNYLNLVLGDSGRFTAAVLPINTTNKGLIWTTSNNKVASIDQNGNMKAIGVGTAIITCKTTDGSNKIATCIVKVTNPIKASEIKLNAKTLSWVVGTSGKLTATVLPTNTTNKGIKWSTSNSTVVTVDQNGNIKAVGVGTAVITVKTTDGSNKTVTCLVKVSTPIKSTGVKLNTTSLTLRLGRNGSLLATVLPSNTTNKELTWVTSNNKVVTIEPNGNIKAVGIGTAEVTCTTKDGSKKYVKCKITVTK